MKKYLTLVVISICLVVLSACSDEKENVQTNKLKVGVMLSDAGLGDQSYSDVGFVGLEKARDELGISFDYRELSDTKTNEEGLEELVEQGNDLVIGLGFGLQQELETVAKRNPDTLFLLIDTQSDLPNVYNVTFKEQEGSFLIGLIAGMNTKSNIIGFVGGEQTDGIKKFEDGFKAGVKAVNPKAKIITKYAGTFGDDKLGGSIAKEMIGKGADYIYPAAGYTGVGVILESQKAGTYSFGVDSDQFYLAESSVVTSMVKQIDVAIYDSIKELVENGSISKKDKQLGLKEGGVALAPIRIINLTSKEQKIIDQYTEEISNGTFKIKE